MKDERRKPTGLVKMANFATAMPWQSWPSWVHGLFQCDPSQSDEDRQDRQKFLAVLAELVRSVSSRRFAFARAAGEYTPRGVKMLNPRPR